MKRIVVTDYVLTFSADKFYDKIGQMTMLGMIDLRRAGEVVDYEFPSNADIVAYFESEESLVKFQMKYL